MDQETIYEHNIITVQFTEEMLEYFVKLWNDNKVKTIKGEIITIEIEANKRNGHAVLKMTSYIPTKEEIGCSKCSTSNEKNIQ